MIEPRKSVRDMAAYRPPLEGRRGSVRLDFNENTAGYPGEVPLVPAGEAATYPEYDAILGRLSAHWGVPRERILLTNGSGEAIFLIAFAYIEPGAGAAVASRPTFALIPHFLHAVGARLVEVPETPALEFDAEGIERALSAGARLALFASPDNPTGAVLDPGHVLRWCARFPDTLFAIDEAYAEYAGRTLLPRAGDPANLVVLRTFSKAWGMAGLRLGAAVGHPDVVDALRRVRLPYSVNAAAVAAALRLLDDPSGVTESARALMERKRGLLAGIAARGWPLHAGNAHFFLLRAGLEAGALCAFCRDRGVLLRDRSSSPELRGMVRVNAGTAEENRRFLDCLDDFRAERSLVFDMDGTLVETSRSFDAAVAEVVARRSGVPLEPGELNRLRAEGGFNDDWDAATELLRRRGTPLPWAQVSREGVAHYLSLARSVERLKVPVETLKRLGRRFRLFVLTGRTRQEYDPVWGEVLDPLFERIYCRDDFPDLPPKPAPDMFRAMMRLHGFAGGSYVGDSVDDMRAAAVAGLRPVGLAGTLTATILLEAGAEVVLDSPERIEEAFPAQ